jgi:hypothetical protein
MNNSIDGAKHICHKDSLFLPGVLEINDKAGKQPEYDCKTD